MTKKQLKEAYTQWNKDITALSKEKDSASQRLRELCLEVTGEATCNLHYNVITLVKAGHGYKALSLLEKYWTAEGEREALKDLAIATNNFEI